MTVAAPIPRPARPWSRAEWFCVAVLCGVAAALYAPAVGHGFVSYDDPLYVTANPHVLAGLSPGGLRWAFTARLNGNWHPLTLVAEMALVSAFGPSAAAFHSASLLLHATTVGLVFALFRPAGRSAAVVTAALWGWHPLRVESVAWAAELKDVLCGCLFVGAAVAYAAHVRRPSLGRYAAVLALGTAAVLAKATAVTLPAALLLVGLWPAGDRRRWGGRRVWELLPLAAVAAANVGFSLVTLRGTRPLGLRDAFPLSVRLSNAAASLLAYLRDVVAPLHLAFFYPHPAVVGRSGPVAAAVAGGLVLLGISVAVCLSARRRPYLFVGWFWFVATLVPASGLVQVGEQARADRFTYLPTIGLTAAVVFLIADGIPRRAIGPAFVAAAIAAAGMIVVTLRTVGYWRDSTALFARADAVVPDNYLAETLLSLEWSRSGRPADGLPLAEKAAAMTRLVEGPSVAAATAWLALAGPDSPAHALRAASFAATTDPGDPLAWDLVGASWDELAAAADRRGDAGRADADRAKAVAAFRTAWTIAPDFTPAGGHLANLLARRPATLPEAIAVWRAVVAQNPRLADAQGQLGDALWRSGDPAGARAAYRAALADGSVDPSWQGGFALLVGSDPNASRADLSLATSAGTAAVAETGGSDPLALDALGLVLARAERYDAAIERATAARGLAAAAGRADLVRSIDRHLARYAVRRPYDG